MRIPITDKFLWDVYSFFEKNGKVKDLMVSPLHAKLDILLDLENPIFRIYKDRKNRRVFGNMMHYLKRKNYIRVENLMGKKAVMITKEGLSKALRASFTANDKVKRSDGKWIMVIFDIPKTHTTKRSLLKGILHNLGYKLLQQSVWVTPYDVSRETEQLFQLHSLDEYVKVFLIEKI
ncbi:MAG: hypothetical protein A2908_03655 [Candidatus Staskawiczbacteria bacterium RIFCSPLOWO2_01_FULL_38_12b]|uniref:Transcriptional repressor PaaX-like central Cas2-like domain-containing protein n=1 Tax=Candidatus Staskawiczbacteria bacterium RIFCSPLOWO2_01_FULL_38_12b TaxID=1802214 RepID=A0A1G2IDC7_9BACT|nr:MAG: hypothetical protein A2908_03655 [Candidatus Staskawiczbacteria bacterium RIFCSPLOWO2_01_FULL_38_12b]